MQLKEIDIRGFKSFPDQTIVSFNEGITAIVGPNGSGKSNISDAVRWVLGEQSIKSLRGNTMKDVIFAGTSNRKPLGYAEVTIVFDNESGKIPIDYNEVAFTRRVFRSGESEYYINKNSCRLMDIRELLMDTGIGKEGYSIIGQGKIDEILSSRSEDRRNIFEEAAGIVKYKSKKENSERKLERTEENLLRVNDLTSELLRQEKSLKIQAEKAEKYKELYSELKKLDINIYIDKLDKINLKLENIDKELCQLNKSLKDNKNQYDILEVKLEELNSNMEKIEIELERLNNAKFELIKKIDSEEGNISLLKEKERFNRKDLERLSKEEKDLLFSLENVEKENIVSSRELKELEFKLDKFKEDQWEDLNLLRNKNKLIKEIENKIDSYKDDLIELYNDISDVKSKYNNIISFNENIDKRLNQLRNIIEEEESNRNLLIESNASIKKNSEKINLKLEKLNGKKVKYIETIKEKEKEFNEIESKLNKINIDIETNLSNYRLYKNMENSYEGYYYGVKSILQASERNQIISENLIGVVADLIRMDSEYELAISTALGGNSQNIVTPNQKSAKIIIEYLRSNKAGRVTCLPLDTIKGRKLNISKEDRHNFNIIGLASEIVIYDDRFKNIIENLLGRTVIINNMENGIKLSNKYNNSLRIVTLEGDIINPGGSMTGGSQGRNTTNILSRKNKIDKIEDDIENYKNKKNNILSKREYLISESKNLKAEYERLLDEIQSIEYEKISIKNRLESEEEQIERINYSIERSENEIKGLKEEEINNLKEKKELESMIKKLENKLEETRNAIKSNEENLKKEIIIRDKSSETVTESRIYLNKEEAKILNINKSLEENQISMEKYKEQIKNNKEEQDKIVDEINKTRLDIEEAVEKIHNYKKESDKLEEEIKKISKIKFKKDEDYKSFIEEEKKLKELIDRITEENNRLDVLKAKEELKKESIDEDIYKNYDMNYTEAKSYKLDNLDIDEAKENLKNLRSEVKKLGNINLNSIEEYANLKERLNFIMEQKKDLDEAKKDLKKVIKDMENKMEDMFIRSFKEINTNFKIIFKTLFNGGNANLILEDEDDILNTGIDIEAQPPGKKLQNLASLSGGERSLVAVSLLFAILKIKPAPFCILDEIDAALDEANIGRYTSYLQQISKDTQFIIITHRKRTMEMADVLYGVTMEEEGVSKLLSVELTEYEEIVS